MNSKLVSRRRIWLSIIVLFLTLAVNTLRATAAPAGNVLLQPTPIPTAQPTQVSAPAEYGLQSVFMVVILLAVLGVLFWFMFVWAQKLDQASYLGNLYRTTIQDIEFKRLKSDLTDKLAKREYHREVVANHEWIKKHPIPEPPAELGEEGEWLASSLLSGYESPEDVYPSSTSPGDDYALVSRFQDLGYMTEAEKADPNSPRMKRIAAMEAYQRKARQWRLEVDREAHRLYRDELGVVRSEAQERAGQAINFDLSVLRGRGAEFVLQFSTVVIIIFAVLVLGVLGILDSQPISTLLAAIIGYVLGQSTSRARSGGAESVAGKTEDQTSVVAQKPDRPAK